VKNGNAYIFRFFQMQELRNSVSMYLTDISSVLNRVPRQLLLILKTNDLLRGIDHQLETSKTSRSFVTMSKCCAEAVAKEELKSCRTWFDRFVVYGRWSIDSARVALYQISVQDFSIPTELLASIATNLVSLLAITLLLGIG
jgi:aarF domain-containing kinase